MSEEDRKKRANEVWSRVIADGLSQAICGALASGDTSREEFLVLAGRKWDEYAKAQRALSDREALAK